MTKAEIVQALYSRVGGFSKKESADIVDMVFEMMKETLGRGEKIKISGFGNFVLRDKRQRPGRNPQTGDPIKISERRVLTFKASQILKQALNPRANGEHEDIPDPDEDEDEDDVAEAGTNHSPTNANQAPQAALPAQPSASSSSSSSPMTPPTPMAAAPTANEAPKE